MPKRPYALYVTLALTTIYVFNQIDRAVFVFVMEPIKQEFGLSDSELGFLAGPALTLLYAILGIPIARWADRSHRLNIMTGAIILWSIIVVLSAAAGRFWHLALARVGVGIGEAGFSAVAQSVISDYHSRAERARALSIFLLAIPISGFISPLMAGYINQAFGWRAVFIAAGLPGILLAILLKSSVREPARAQATQNDSLPQPPLRQVLAQIWRTVALRNLAIGMAMLTLLSGGVLGWQATFFLRIHEVPSAELGVWLAVISGIGGGIGIWLGGQIGHSIPSERRQLLLLSLSGLVAGVFLWIMLLAPLVHVSLAMAFLASLVLHFFYAPAFAIVQTLAPANMRTTIIAIIIFLQILAAGIMGLQLTGLISDAIEAQFAGNALRFAMLAMTPAALIAAFALFSARNFIEADLANKAAVVAIP